MTRTRGILAVVAALALAVVAVPIGAAPSPAPDWIAETDEASAGFGVVRAAGDVNGDGYGDVIVGAYRKSAAYVYLGSADGLSPSPAWSVVSDQPNSLFGNSVGAADVNGDGYSDVIVGAHYYNSGQPYEGKAFVYHGSAAGLSTTPNWTGEGNLTYGEYATSVGTAGDVNGDGFDDVVVGSQYYECAVGACGRAWVYHGSAAGLSVAADWTVGGARRGGRFGSASGTAGDINGDGYADLIVGEPIDDYGLVLKGRAYAFYGAASGLSTIASWVVETDQAGSSFGGSVGTAGDVNGDGYADIAVGAIRYDNGETDEGRVYLYLGSAAGLAVDPTWTAEGDQAGAYFGGVGAGTAGDVNGDGYADVIIGSHSYDNGETDEGRAVLYYGSASGLEATPAWSAESDQAGANFGYSSTAGDVNGDGAADVVVGAPEYDNGQTGEGRAYAYYGVVMDTEPPIPELPDPIRVRATSRWGAIVTFEVTATDVVDPNPAVSCAPPSGSMFPIGVTTVTCTATDWAGNVATASFTVTVCPKHCHRKHHHHRHHGHGKHQGGHNGPGRR